MWILKAFIRWLYKTLNLLTETILVNVLIVDILSNTKKTLTPSTFTMSDVNVHYVRRSHSILDTGAYQRHH